MFVLAAGWLCYAYTHHGAAVNPTPRGSLSLRCWVGKGLSLLCAMHGSQELDLSTQHLQASA